MIMKEMSCIRHLAVDFVLQHMQFLPDAATLITSVWSKLCRNSFESVRDMDYVIVKSVMLLSA
jgi:hypothetical protein